MTRTRYALLTLLATLFSTAALAQQLASPKTITASSSSCTSASCIEISTQGVFAIGINVEGAGTYALAIEASKNRGTTWYPLNAVDESDPDTLIQEISAPGNFATTNAGITNLRVRASSLSSGTPVVTLSRGFLTPLTAIATGGGGGGTAATEYTEGATDASITGVFALMEDSNVARPLQGTVADGLLVNLGANNDVTVSSLPSITGTVTANAGTNLNTSALALESGGNLAAIATSVGTLDNAIAGNELQVDVITMPAVTVSGVSTAANQTTVIGHVDGLETLIGTTNTTLTTIDGRVDGLEGLLGTTNTALGLIDNPVGSATGGTAGTSSFLGGGIYNVTPPTLTNGQQSSFQFDVNGNLKTSLVGSIEADLTVGAQPADDPHYVRCSDGSVAAPCVVTATDLDVQSGGADILSTTAFNAAFGTAGTADSQVLSVQGISGGTALPVSLASVPSHAVTNAGTFAVQVDGASLTALQLIDNLPNTIGSTTSGQSGALGLAAVTTSAPTYTTAQSHPLSLQTDGSLRAAITNTVTVGAHAVTNAGTFVTQENGAALTALQLIDNIVASEDAAAGTGYAGVPLLVQRQDSHSDLAADGDFITPTVDADGGLRVSIVAGAGSGGTALADDADFTAGTTSFTPVGGFYQSSVTACTDGDTCAAGITAGRAVKVAMANSDGSLVTLGTDTTIGSAVATTGPTGLAIYSDFDGSALPTASNVDTEGEGVPIAASIKGVQYVMLVSEDGSLERGTSTTPMIVGDGSGALNVICDSGCSGGTQFNEDAAHASGNAGTMALAVRNDAGTALAADGDYIPLAVNSAGSLYTTVTGTVTVGSHAVTNAGTFVTQENGAALTALQLIDNLPNTIGSTTSGQSGALGLAAVTTSAPTYTTAQSHPLSLQTDGSLRAAITNTVTVASHAVTNAGTFVTQENGAALTALQLIDNPIFVDDAAFTPGTSSVHAVGFQVDETSTDSVDEGDIGAPRMSLDRIAYFRPGGASVHYRTSAGATEDEHEVKGSAGILYSVLVTNTNAAVRYIRCYNLTAANTTPGTSTVFWGAAIPGATTGAGFTYSFPSGLTFDTALTCAFTTGAADSDVAEVAANEIKAVYSFR